LREPVSALRRADALMLTRADLAEVTPAERLARRMNPMAPVFHSAVKLTGLTEIATGKAHPPSAIQDKPLFAFCGLGNAKGFFASLRNWNCTVVGEKAFPDHHIYLNREIIELARMAAECKAEACLTTEKDAMNLPWTALGECRLPIFCCVIRAEVREAAQFEALLLATALSSQGRRA
jgi:tetraacyldisaccharide 4'-kinase